jgi:phospholipid transport system substrate-binding protein
MGCERFATGHPRLLPADRQAGSARGIRPSNVLQYILHHLNGAGALARLARILAGAGVVIAGVSAAPYPAATPADFIGALGAQALKVVRSHAAWAQKAAYFEHMLRRDFDLVGLSRFVLGPYWRLASKAQRQEFRNLLEERIVRFNGERLLHYGGERFRVTGSQVTPAGGIVTSVITRPQGPPIEVDWRLRVSNGLYKISDLTIDGVSMALTLRSEFSRLIQREGGQVAPFLARLRQQIEGPAFGVGASAPRPLINSAAGR